MSSAVSTRHPPPFALTTRRANLLLLALGGVMATLFFKGAHDQNLGRVPTFVAGALAAGVPYALASAVAWRAPAARSTLWLALGFALLFRVGPLTSQVYLSTDAYRYVWDGRVQAAGVNPYRYIPADLALVPLRDDAIYNHINRRDYAKTLYPPAAEALFWLVTRVGESVQAMRVAMVLCEAAAVWCLAALLRGRGEPVQRVLLYAWHPLAVWEFAGGAHCDALMLAATALALLMHARGRPYATGAALGLAVLAKLFPVILFPALYRRFRWSWRMPLALAATVCAGYLPYAATYSWPGALGFLGGYAQEEGMGSGERFYFLNLLPLGWLNAHGISAYRVFLGIALALFALAAGWAVWRREADGRSAIRRCAAVAALLLAVLSPAVDWYFTWLLVFLPIIGEAWLVWLPTAGFILYLNWFHTGADDVYLQNSFIFLPAIALWAGKRMTNDE